MARFPDHTAERDAGIATRFTGDVAHHQMRIELDQNGYRHLRFAQPNSSFYWFEVITWPSHLMVNGDMGTFVFHASSTDMLAFFRSTTGAINPDYWAQKLLAAPASTPGRRLGREFSLDALRHHLWSLGKDWRREAVLTSRERATFKAELAAFLDDLADDESAALEAADGYAWVSGVGDTFEFDWDDLYDSPFEHHTVHFLWTCHAIVHAITTYDTTKTKPKAQAARRAGFPIAG